MSNVNRLTAIALITAFALATPAIATAAVNTGSPRAVCIDPDTGMLRDCADWYTIREVRDDGSIYRKSCKLVREFTRTTGFSILWGLITIGHQESEDWCDYGSCGEMTAVDSQLR